MNEKVNAMLKWAVFANVGHMLVAWVNSYLGKDQLLGMIFLMVFALGVWFFMGFRFGMGALKGKDSEILSFGIVSILPALLYTVVAQVMQGSSEAFTGLQNYNWFYFLGAPILFWNAPFYPMMNLFQNSNIYIQMNINILFVLLVSLIGGFAGRSYRIQQLKRKKRLVE